MQSNSLHHYAPTDSNVLVTGQTNSCNYSGANSNAMNASLLCTYVMVAGSPARLTGERVCKLPTELASSIRRGLGHD